MTAPVCESVIHEFGPFAPAPPADYTTDLHGCANRYVCRGCLIALDEGFARRTEPIACPDCQRPFHTINGYINWRPL